MIAFFQSFWVCSLIECGLSSLCLCLGSAQFVIIAVMDLFACVVDSSDDYSRGLLSALSVFKI